MTHFNLPDGFTEAKKDKLKAWALKKIAEQFQTFKKKIWGKYKKTKETPTFTGALEKQKDHWNAFKVYKESSEALERSAKK